MPGAIDSPNTRADMVSRHRSRFVGGVVHSFDGTHEHLQQLLRLDLLIGINGWYAM